MPIFVLGNKSDLEHERAVSKEKIQAFMSQHPEFNYLETSATDGTNVNSVFLNVAQSHLKIKAASDDFSTDLPSSIDQANTKKKFDLD